MADLAPSRAFPAPTAPPPPNAGLHVRERRGVGLATIVVRRGQEAALAAALGFAPPDGPRIAYGPNLKLMGLGPATLLALAPHPAPDFATALAAHLAPAASVSDQSSAYALLHLTGPAVPALLAKGIFLDLAHFAPGQAAATQLAHLSVLLWRDDTGYTLACPRSYASSLWHWLTISAAEFGLAHSD